MEYLKIIEENFTHSDYVAYLQGSLLMALLQDKLLDIPQFKLYANKLAEVMDKPQVENKPLVVSVAKEPQKEPTVDPDEPKIYKTHEFKLGDHVLISKGTEDERTGTIIRLPMDGVDCRSSYLVKLDDKNLGWKATVEDDGVSSENAWYTYEMNMELLEEKPHGTLEKDKWYHTKDFTVEELKELLPNGTHLQVEKEAWYNGIETEPPTKTQTSVVVGISTSCIGDEPLIEINGSIYLREWFKITEENE